MERRFMKFSSVAVNLSQLGQECRFEVEKLQKARVVRLRNDKWGNRTALPVVRIVKYTLTLSVLTHWLG